VLTPARALIPVRLTCNGSILSAVCRVGLVGYWHYMGCVDQR